MPTSIRFAHPLTLNGVHYSPRDVATLDDDTAQRILTAGYAVLTTTPIPPDTNQDPFPQYLLRSEASGSSALVVANTQSGTTYTLAVADQGTVIETTAATAVTITVPANSAAAFPVGVILEICQAGAGQVTLTPAAGVTLRNPASLSTRAQWSELLLRKRATDEWVVGGDLA